MLACTTLHVEEAADPLLNTNSPVDSARCTLRFEFFEQFTLAQSNYITVDGGKSRNIHRGICKKASSDA
jgi:hypothetical protein